MKRFWVHLGVTVGTAVFTGAIVSACAHDDSSLFIRNALAPLTQTMGVCAFTGDVSQTGLSSGVLDLAFGGTVYTPELLLGNQIVTTANEDMEQTETSRIIITGAITRLTDLNGNNLPQMLSAMCANHDAAACAAGHDALKLFNAGLPPNPFSTEETGAIEPGDGTTASYLAMPITIVDGTTIAILQDYFEQEEALMPGSAIGNSIELLTFTKAEGYTLGGDAEESNEFEFPVLLCYGCLLTNLVTDTASPVGHCIQSPGASAATLPCVPGQDVAITVSQGTIPGIANCPGDGGVSIAADAGP
jgi:hypothetical protein